MVPLALEPWNVIYTLLVSIIAVSTLISPTMTNAQQNQDVLVNWLEICNNPLVDAIVVEPCNSLTTPDGYTLTQEGERVLGCLAGGTLAVLVGIPELTSMADMVGCGEGNSVNKDNSFLESETSVNEEPASTIEDFSWKYHVREDSLSYYRLPGNWHLIPNNGPEESTGLQYLFGYLDSNGESDAGITLFVNKSGTFPNARVMANTILAESTNVTNILEPIRCDVYKFNNETACSFIISMEINDIPMKFLYIISENSEGIEMIAGYFAPMDMYDKLLYPAQEILESIKIDYDKVNEYLGIPTPLNLLPHLTSVQPNNSSILDTTNQTVTKPALPAFEITEF